MLFTINGQSSKLEQFANAPTLEEQRRLYEKNIRPVLVSGTFVKLVLSNPIFLWNSLGVPMNQLAVLTKETSEYMVSDGDSKPSDG
jgi:betaine lipid synthase